VACSGVISSSTTGWVSASFSGGSIAGGSNYWIALAASSQDWSAKFDNGGTHGYFGGTDVFTNEPATLPAISWFSLNRYYSGYVTVASSAPPAEYYVAVGDSITFGYNDDFPGDDISLDGRNSGGGYEPILNNLLTAANGVPHTVVNVGVNGATSANGAAQISTTLSNHPAAKYYLVMYGTNDARQSPAVPSGSYKANMQAIISAILAAGKTPYLAKVPYSSAPGIDILSIQNYNLVVDELVFDNEILVIPPDFYTYFQSNPGKLGSDGIHPNGTGYQSMADLWFTALTTP
jgi:lysophospholipase L1-like esterase